jgi:transcriptional regulator with XRE-family HTH domain
MTDRDIASPAALRAVGLTQKRLAEILGVSTNAANRWHAGKHPTPRYARTVLWMWGRLSEADRAELLAWVAEDEG